MLDLGKIEGLLEEKEQIPGERFKLGQRVRVYLFDLKRGGGRGVQALVSRTHRNIIKRLFELEVPEIFEGRWRSRPSRVSQAAARRSPSGRARIALIPSARASACVAARINNVINELNGEKIDIILWSPDPAQFVANALSPVKPLNVELRESDHTALVTVPERQLSLAIGKEGQNARLAAKLTGWRIDVIRPDDMRARRSRRAPSRPAPIPMRNAAITMTNEEDSAAPAQAQSWQPKPRHIPLRTCIACRRSRPKRELIRIVRTPDGHVVLDPTGKKSGRGAYLVRGAFCWEPALRKGKLEHEFDVTLSPEDRADSKPISRRCLSRKRPRRPNRKGKSHEPRRRRQGTTP